MRPPAPRAPSPPYAMRRCGGRVVAVALLAYCLEHLLATGEPATPPAPVSSPWDAWWVTYRAALPASELGVDPAYTTTRCGACIRDVVALTGAAPRHPDTFGPRRCGCLASWARQMRRPEPDPMWPLLRSCLAMVKPDAEPQPVREMLQPHYRIVATSLRRLSTGDVRRLYPDAYGADFVAAQDAYLTSAPVQVLVLLGGSTPPRPKQTKLHIRQRLGATDTLRNLLHMPDNPGDALADLHHLAGPTTLRHLYEGYDRDGTTWRLAQYRALLALR